MPPTIIQYEVDKKDRLSVLNGYEHSNTLGSFPTHIACSKSNSGKKYIETLNQLINKPETRAEMISAYTNEMLGTDVRRFKREFELHRSKD